MVYNLIVRISALAKIVILDGIRRHAVLGLIMVAFAAEISSLFFYQFIPRDIARFASDFVLSIGWMISLLFLFFHAVQTVSWDSEKRVIQAIMTRPLSRANYMTGLFIGLATLLFLLNSIVGLLGWGNLLLIQQAVAAYFPTLSLKYYIISWAGLLSMEFMILSVILFFSSIMRGSFPVLLMIICYYFICNGLPVVRESMANAKNIPDTVILFLQWLTVVFPDFSRMDYREFIISTDSLPSVTFIATNFIYSTIYIVFFLYAGSIVFQQRDLS